MIVLLIARCFLSCLFCTGLLYLGCGIVVVSDSHGFAFLDCVGLFFIAMICFVCRRLF